MVDHVTIYRWVQRFTPEFIEAARPARHLPGDRWFTDETYLKIAGTWTYLYRAVDQHGPGHRCPAVRAARPGGGPAVLHPGATRWHGPSRVTTDRAPVYPRILDELIPSALHTVQQYVNNPIESDHGRSPRRRPGAGPARPARPTARPPG